MRRGAGIAAIKRKQQQEKAVAEKGQELGQQLLEDQKKQLEEFRTNLEEFSFKHKKEINNNPVFRNEFLSMCREIGVDPLSCK